MRILFSKVQRPPLSASLQGRVFRLSSRISRIHPFSFFTALLLSFFFDFSIWLPTLCKIVALLLQAGILVRLIFEERYLWARFRRLPLKKKLIPITLFAIALLFYLEKGWLLAGSWADGGESLRYTYRLYSMIFLGAAFSIYAMRLKTIGQFLERLHLRPAQTMALSFALVILLGALLLSLPQVVIDPSRISFVDALFTATSATTVTGLSLFPISDYYERSGLWVILLLIQLGGLGIMTFGALFSLISKRDLRLDEAVALQGVLEPSSIGVVRREIGAIFIMTLAIEAVGTLLLWFSFQGENGRPLFTALFHSISAFCNAGFSLFPANLEGRVTDLPVNLVIALLIVLGGLGFPVLHNLGSYPLFRKNRSGWRLTFHSKVVLSISAGLLLAGTVGIFIFEYRGVLAPLPWRHKWMAAAFQSVTARTAGFNTLNIGLVSDATLFLLILLMWIGGSPISTAGGIKTTTFGVMLATLRSLLRRREEVELFRRSLSPQVTQKALSVGVTSSALMALLLLLLLAVEGGGFREVLFEAVSAFNTVGLSTGITPRFSPLGKLILVVIMFVGRIGPLTLAFCLAERAAKGSYRYPQERVIVG
ncbi:MAG TPA: potassium transporter TrkG [Candidatus Manganitrophaceae bacterium]|nr:potassium transporter TrkG [Candidatus Manganitrophaceae bacterium]